MKPEYVEGAKAQRNFEQGMKSLFKVPKVNIVQREKLAKRKKIASARKEKRADKD